jgi:hypothetical protein
MSDIDDRFTDEDYLQEFEYHMEQAADMIRGRQMTEDEWGKYRQLWAGVGMTLAPCKPGAVDSDKDSTDDAYDRAMDFLQP